MFSPLSPTHPVVRPPDIDAVEGRLEGVVSGPGGRRAHGRGHQLGVVRVVAVLALAFLGLGSPVQQQVADVPVVDRVPAVLTAWGEVSGVGGSSSPGQS